MNMPPFELRPGVKPVEIMGDKTDAKSGNRGDGAGGSGSVDVPVEPSGGDNPAPEPQ
jgi:hypothetical protein